MDAPSGVVASELHHRSYAGRASHLKTPSMGVAVARVSGRSVNVRREAKPFVAAYTDAEGAVHTYVLYATSSKGARRRADVRGVDGLTLHSLERRGQQGLTRRVRALFGV